MYETATIKVRKATAIDFKADRKTLKIGVPYWLKSLKTGGFDNNNYISNPFTDTSELAEYLEMGMVYIPVSYFEMQDEDINHLKVS